MENNSSNASVKIKSSESQGLAYRIGALTLSILVLTIINGFVLYNIMSYHSQTVKMYESTKKQVWELKTAFNLQFSDERSREKK